MSLHPSSKPRDIQRLNEERAKAIAAFGFTEREARFLLTATVHSGVFVERQYCALPARSASRLETRVAEFENSFGKKRARQELNLGPSA